MEVSASTPTYFYPFQKRRRNYNRWVANQPWTRSYFKSTLSICRIRLRFDGLVCPSGGPNSHMAKHFQDCQRLRIVSIYMYHLLPCRVTYLCLCILRGRRYWCVYGYVGSYISCLFHVNHLHEYAKEKPCKDIMLYNSFVRSTILHSCH